MQPDRQPPPQKKPSITHSCSLSRKLGEGRAATQPPTHATNTHHKNTTPHTLTPPFHHLLYISLNLSPRPFSPHANTAKALSTWALLSIMNPNLTTRTEVKMPHNMHINKSLHMNYVAHLNTSHVSPSLSPISHGLPGFNQQRSLCRNESLNKSSKYARLNMSEWVQRARHIYCWLMMVVIYLSELSTAKRAGNVITASLLSAYDLPATSWGQMTCRPYCFKQTVDSNNWAAWKVDHNITPPSLPVITHMLLDISSYTPTR